MDPQTDQNNQGGGTPTPPPGQGQGGQGAPIPPPPAVPMPGTPVPPPAVPIPPQPAAPMPGVPMPGAGMPPAGMPAGGMTAGGMPGAGAPIPPPEPEDTTPANFQLGAKLPPELNVPVPKHELNFDEKYFLRLLAGSISLSRDEKKKIVESIPKLRQEQIDELVKIFEEEKQKFAALSKKHVPQLEKLADQHHKDWMDLEASYQQDQQKEEDTGKAEEIRKQLGL